MHAPALRETHGGRVHIEHCQLRGHSHAEVEIHVAQTQQGRSENHACQQRVRAPGENGGAGSGHGSREGSANVELQSAAFDLHRSGACEEYRIVDHGGCARAALDERAGVFHPVIRAAVVWREVAFAVHDERAAQGIFDARREVAGVAPEENGVAGVIERTSVLQHAVDELPAAPGQVCRRAGTHDEPPSRRQRPGFEGEYAADSHRGTCPHRQPSIAADGEFAGCANRSSVACRQRASIEVQDLRARGPAEAQLRNGGARVERDRVGSVQVDHGDVLRARNLIVEPVGCHRPVPAGSVRPHPFRRRQDIDRHRRRPAGLMPVGGAVGECRRAGECSIRRRVGERAIAVADNTAGSRGRLGEIEKRDRIVLGIDVVDENIASGDRNALRRLSAVGHALRRTVRHAVGTVHVHGKFSNRPVSVAGPAWTIGW